MSTWIPISERMPTREDADERGEVVWKWKDGTLLTAPFDDRDNSDDAPVAWLPIPKYTPPKPEPTNFECDTLAHNIWASRWSAAKDPIPVIKVWFASVTARIEREKGK